MTSPLHLGSSNQNTYQVIASVETLSIMNNVKKGQKNSIGYHVLILSFSSRDRIDGRNTLVWFTDGKISKEGGKTLSVKEFTYSKKMKSIS